VLIGERFESVVAVEDPEGLPVSMYLVEGPASATLEAGTGKLRYDTGELTSLLRLKSEGEGTTATVDALNISFTVAARDLAGAESRVSFVLTVMAGADASGELYTYSTDADTAAQILREREQLPDSELHLPQVTRDCSAFLRGLLHRNPRRLLACGSRTNQSGTLPTKVKRNSPDRRRRTRRRDCRRAW
jgi:hypothetical protein